MFSQSVAEQLALERLAGDNPRTELICPGDDSGSPIYRLGAGRQKPKVFRRARPESGLVSVVVAGLLWRLLSFLAYVNGGNYGAAGPLVERSQKLAPFKPLLRRITGNLAFLVLALYRLGELDSAKEPT